MVDTVLYELAVPGGPFVLIIDDRHELSAGYGENARAGVKAHLDTATRRGHAHHRGIHRVLAAAHIEEFITTTWRGQLTCAHVLRLTAAQADTSLMPNSAASWRYVRPSALRARSSLTFPLVSLARGLASPAAPS